MQEVMTIFNSVYSQSGAAGILVLLLVLQDWYNKRTIKEITCKHTTERKDWLDTAKEHHSQLITLNKETITVLSEIKRLIDR